MSRGSVEEGVVNIAIGEERWENEDYWWKWELSWWLKMGVEWMAEIGLSEWLNFGEKGWIK